MRKFKDNKRWKEKIEEELKSINPKIAMYWAIECASRVLHFYEEENPTDQRPRKAIESGKEWAKGKTSVGIARKSALSAHSAAREAWKDTEREAARSAGQTAAVAHMVRHAIHASTYAIKAVGYASEMDGDIIAKEREWQFNELLRLKKEEIS